jgi:hypothetical protein
MMGFLDNLEAYIDFTEDIDKDPELESGYSTGKWSDDDDIHPTITPVFGPNGWDNEKCKQVFDELMDKYLVSKDLK